MARKCACCSGVEGSSHDPSCPILLARPKGVRVNAIDAKIFECGCSVRLFPDGVCKHIDQLELPIIEMPTAEYP